MSLAAEVRMKGFGCCLKLKIVGNPIIGVVLVVLVGYTDLLLKTLPVLTRPDALLMLPASGQSLPGPHHRHPRGDFCV